LNKNKNYPWSQIDLDDLWMGLALMMACRSPLGNACLLVESDKLLYVGLETHPKYNCNSKMAIAAEIDAIMNCPISYSDASLFLTTTPSSAGLMAIASISKVQRLVYFAKNNSDIEKDLTNSPILSKYQGNLNWLRDYVRSLDLLGHKP